MNKISFVTFAYPVHLEGVISKTNQINQNSWVTLFNEDLVFFNNSKYRKELVQSPNLRIKGSKRNIITIKWPKVVKVTRKKYIYYKQSLFQFLNPSCCRSYYFAVKEFPAVRKDRLVVPISKQIFPFNSQNRFAFPKMCVFVSVFTRVQRMFNTKRWLQSWMCRYPWKLFLHVSKWLPFILRNLLG